MLVACAEQLGAAARLGQPDLVVTLELVGQQKGSYPSEQDEYPMRLGGHGVLREKFTTQFFFEKVVRKKKFSFRCAKTSFYLLYQSNINYIHYAESRPFSVFQLREQIHSGVVCSRRCRSLLPVLQLSQCSNGGNKGSETGSSSSERRA